MHWPALSSQLCTGSPLSRVQQQRKKAFTNMETQITCGDADLHCQVRQLSSRHVISDRRPRPASLRAAAAGCAASVTTSAVVFLSALIARKSVSFIALNAAGR
jgi:hypothetical protein